MKNDNRIEKMEVKESSWHRQINFRNFVIERSYGKHRRKGVKK